LRLPAGEEALLPLHDGQGLADHRDSEGETRRVYKTIGSTGKPDRTATGCYAMGWTQHTVGVQNIRAFTIVQLLLGNMGMAGAE